MHTSRNRQRGYALLVMVILLTMSLLYGVVTQLSLVGLKAQRNQGAQSVLVQAKEALVGFAATYRDDSSHDPLSMFGYLPCPDTDGDGVSDTVANGTQCGSGGQTVVGLLPYRTLGLPDLRDAAGNCLWYVVSGSFKLGANGTRDAAGTANFIPMNWDTQGQIAVVDAAANNIVAPNDANGGAAAVIIAPGVPLAGQNRTVAATTCGAAPTAAQVAAYLDGGYAFPAAGTVALTEGSNDSNTNNDLILPVTPKDIFSRIVARADFKNPADGNPVGQLNAVSNTIKLAIEKQIQSDLGATGTPTGISAPSQVGYTQFAGKQLGDMAAAVALTNASDQNFLDNWRNQYRYVVCSDLTTPCLSIAGTSCRAALMLGGQSTSGGPRTATQNVSTTVALDNFFEAGKGREILNSVSTAFIGNTAYLSPTVTTSEDVATCVFPGTFTSFAQNISSFASGLTGSGSGGNALASVNTGAHTVTLGSSGGLSGVGCVWDANVLPLNSSLRLYMRVNFASKGNGLAIALADGATNLAPNDGTRSQIMCGAQGADTLGYSGIPPADASGTPPAGTSAGIASPKLGIEFDARYDASRSDPYTDHLAFLYWGDASDNGAGGTGANDNTHYLGSSGTAITAATWAGNVATITTASPHGLAANQVVLVSGMAPSDYNGTYTVSATGLSSKQFTYTLHLAAAPGSLTTAGMVKPVSAGAAPRNPRIATALNSTTISSAVWQITSGGRVTVTTLTPHNLSIGQKVYVTGITPAGYNGVFTVSSLPLVNPTTRFRYLLSSNPGFYVSGGSIPAKESEISSLTWSAGTALANTAPDNHGFNTPQTVATTGITPNGYSTLAAVTKLNSKMFSFPLATDPDGSFSTEIPTGMSILKNSSTAPHNYLKYSSLPTGTPIYVRLDISRTYDNANHIAVLNMKAYIGDIFGSIPDTCGTSEFQDMTQDVADQCPFRTVTLQQDSIPINPIATITAATCPVISPYVVNATAAGHRLVNGATVTISGATPASYNGTYTVTVIDANTFSYTLPAAPSSCYVSGGDVQPLSTVYLGFTNARGSTSSVEDQSAAIDQLIVRSQ